MKKPNRYIMITTALLVSLLCSCSVQNTQSVYVSPAPQMYTISDELLKGELIEVASNQQYKLFFQTDYAYVKVYDIKNDTFWSTNPEEAITDPDVLDVEKNRLLSQFEIEYFEKSGSVKSLDSYSFSVELKQYTYEKTENGVKVFYTVGKKAEPGKEMLPQIISKERFETLILNNITDEYKRTVMKNRYSYITLDNVTDNDKIKEITEKYPSVKKYNLYALKKMENFQYAEVKEIIDEAGYTIGDLKEDNEQNGIESDVVESTVFNVTMVYTLAQDSLKVEVPGEQLRAPASFPIKSLKVLPYFGAAKQSEDGYVFLPDGSGTILSLDNSKSMNPVYLDVYGKDLALREYRDSFVKQQTLLPVFGLKSNDKAFFAVIEKGDAIASLASATGGIVSSYSNVYASFLVRNIDTVNFGNFPDKNSIVVYQNNPFMGTISIKFMFLNGEKANYAGMAELYRNHLVARGVLHRSLQEEPLSLTLEMILSVNKSESVLGVIPVNRLYVTTEYEDVKSVADRLASEKIKNSDIVLAGWFNSGYNQTVAKSIKPVSALGSQKSLIDTIRYIQQMGYSVSPRVNFSTVTQSGNGFNIKEESAYYLGSEYVKLYHFDKASYIKKFWETASYIITPSKINAVVSSFLEKYADYNNKSICVGDLTRFLYSGYSQPAEINRQDASELIVQALALIRDRGYSIVADNANGYALQYSDKIINIPLDSSGMVNEDYAVPFLQMVIHGYIPYSGTPMNLSDDFSEDVLKHIEYGAAPYFTFAYRNIDKLKNMPDVEFYAVDYASWIDDVVRTYRLIQPVADGTGNAVITSHRKLAENVFMTTYDNGQGVIVNYNFEDVMVGTKTVKARDFLQVSGVDT